MQREGWYDSRGFESTGTKNQGCKQPTDDKLPVIKGMHP